MRGVGRSSLIFDISEILSQSNSCETHSPFSVPECPTFLVKISHDELSVCTDRVQVGDVHCTMILPANVKLKLCLGSVTVLNCELTNHKCMKYFLTAILKNDALSVVMLSVLLRPEL